MVWAVRRPLGEGREEKRRDRRRRERGGERGREKMRFWERIVFMKCIYCFLISFYIGF